MKNIVLPEKDFQRYIADRLVQDNGYIERDAAMFDRGFAMDLELLFRFLESTQPEKMERLRQLYEPPSSRAAKSNAQLEDECLRGEDFKRIVAAALNARLTAPGGSLASVLKHGFDVGPVHLDIAYTKPATSLNEKLTENYEKNIFSVMLEVQASDSERVDIVIFLNGLPIAAIELKSESARQDWQDAVAQWRTKRNPKTRLFLFKAGCLVFFAMDTQNVCMATKLDGMKTFFLPFNRGSGEGVDAGGGNPVVEGHFGTEYMWEDILTKDTLLDVISRFVFVDVRKKDGLKSKKETLIFPRYHQLDAVRKLLKDVKRHGTLKNYLIHHGAGSGKTFTLAWLACSLASLHDEHDRAVYDTIIIMTDRVVVDRQLQQAVLNLDHQRGLIAAMDEKKTSADLAAALQSRYKIIVTTIQKFPYVVEQVTALKDRRFAFIIDEAHSSTAGKDMAAAFRTVASGESMPALPEDASEEEREAAAEEAFLEQVRALGKRENMNVFAFTATPKPKTLRMFGQLNADGKYEAFHTYSMRQAIEEGFILDVLQNYTTYSTAYELCKKVEDDALYRTGEAKRQIARFIALHETNIAQRVEIVVEHFRQNVAGQLCGQAKGMVVTGSRAEALAYWKEINAYVEKKGYNLKVLAAFSGKVYDGDAKKDVGEAELNGFPENRTADIFNVGDYRLLVVANKYQTGYDEPKLCAMYVFKKLRGVAAVQTLSRLNRICHLGAKKPFVLDFANSCEDIKKAFAPYYTVTMLADSATPEALRTLSARLDGWCVLEPDDEDRFYSLACAAQTAGRKPAIRDQKSMNFLLEKAKKRFGALREADGAHERKECLLCMRRFVKLYEFLILVSSFEDYDMHRRYVFLNMLEKMLDAGGTGEGFDLKGKLETEYIVQKKTGEHEGEMIESADPILSMPAPDAIFLEDDEKKTLDQIIAEINSRMGTAFDRDLAVKSTLQIKDLLSKSKSLRKKARSNDQKTFELSYFDELDDALMEGFEQNRDFFNMLLNNDDVKKRLLGIFAGEIYRMLKGKDGKNGTA